MRGLIEEYGLSIVITVLGVSVISGFAYILNYLSGMSF